MGKKGLYIIMLFLFAGIVLIVPAYSQNIPEPKPKIHCSYDGNWYSPEEYKIYCKPPQKPSPQGSFSSPGVGLSPSQQMQLQMFQSIFAPLFGAIGSSVAELIIGSPSRVDPYQQELQRKQQEILKKQQEEEKKKAIEAWKKQMKEAEEQARKEAEARRKAGWGILKQVGIGNGPFGRYTIIGPPASERETLSSINWDNPRATPSAAKSSETAKEQLLRTAYFSKMAETFLQSGDLEAARFYAGLAFEGGANSPRVIEYRPPKELLDAMDSKKAAELNKQLTKYSTFYRLAMPNFEKLQTIFTELEQVKIKKEELEKTIKEIETQIKEIEAKKQIAETPEKKVETDNLLAKALALKQQAEVEYQEALQNEQRLLNEKQVIESRINELKANVLANEKK